jgi:MATE family multidrug resistance protein
MRNLLRIGLPSGIQLALEVGAFSTGTLLMGRIGAAAAAFQVFDGIQIVMTGALRGLGETRIPMAANLFGHWFLGLPCGALLAFKLGVGALGIWIGFCLGLAAVAASLTLVWRVRSRDLGQGPRALGPHPEEAFDLAGGEVRP